MSQRIEKVQKVAKEVLGEAITGLKDPRIGFVTVTAVRVSPDLRHARVWVSIYGTDEEQERSMEGLASATPVLRSELNRQMRIKYVPDLEFALDTGAQEAEKLERLLNKIHDEEGEAIVRYGASDWPEIISALKRASSVTIACHVNPDGDAIGSTLGLSLGLRSLGKETYPTWGTDDPVVPSTYEFLAGSDSFVRPADLPETDVFVALDCGALDRLGDLGPAAQEALSSINIDHHPGNDEFGKLNAVAPEASSTAEMTGFLLKDMDVAIDKDVATCLYTGIVTDTGRFQYANSSAETLRLAADLLERGVDAPLIAQEVFESAPFGYLRLVGIVLERARLLPEERFVYSWVTLKDLEETGVPADETDKLIDAVRSTGEASVAALFKELSTGGYKVSLRSKGPVSVGEIARSANGGGHELASGFTCETVEVGLEHILTRLRG